MITTLPGAFPTSPGPPKQPPRRTDSLSTNIAKPKPTSPIVQSADDVKAARALLQTPLSALKEEDVLSDEEREQRREDREQELVAMLTKMTGWVEQLGDLLHEAYKNQTDLETALTLTRSNLQLALANTEMLEDALKRSGDNGKDVGWKRWSEKEDMRRSSSLKEGHSSRSQSLDGSSPSSSTPTSTTSRFFGFPSFRAASTSPAPSPSNTSPTTSTTQTASAESPTTATSTSSTLLPAFNTPTNISRSTSPVPGSAGPSNKEKELVTALEKEKAKAKELAAAKEQLENELESLSQALFEEANKMVSEANRKLAETEEELRVVADQRDALKGALRIVEGENGALRSLQQQLSSPMTPGSEGQVLTIPQLSPMGPDTAASIYSDMETPRAMPTPSDLTPTPTQATAQATTQATTQSLNPPTLTIPVVTVTPSHPSGSFWSPITPDSATPSPSQYSQPSATPSRRFSSSPSPLSPVPESPGSSIPPGTPMSGMSTTDPETSTRSVSPSRTDSPTLPPDPSLRVPAPEAPSTGHGGEEDTSIEEDDGTHLSSEGEHKSVRWSVIPKTPRSRDAVREEFEEALKRMQKLVGEEEVSLDEDAEEDEIPSAKEEEEEDGKPSPNITFAPISDEDEDGPRWEEVLRDRSRQRSGSEEEVEKYVGI